MEMERGKEEWGGREKETRSDFTDTAVCRAH